MYCTQLTAISSITYLNVLFSLTLAVNADIAFKLISWPLFAQELCFRSINESIFVFIFLILLPISLRQRRQQSSVSLEELIKRKIDPLGFAFVSPLRVSPFVTSRITWPTAQLFIPWKFFLVAWNHCGAVSLGNPLHFCWIMQLAKQSLCQSYM